MTERLAPSYLLLEATTATAEGLRVLGDAWVEAAGLARSVGGPGAAEPSIGILVFNFGITQSLPLAPLDGSVPCPNIEVGDTSMLEAADLRYFRELITHDLDWLKANGQQVVRPTVSVVAASEPNGDWAAGLHDLLDSTFNYRPNIVAFDCDSAANFVTQIGDAATLPPEPGMTVAQRVSVSIEQSIELAVRSATSGKLSPPDRQARKELPGRT